MTLSFLKVPVARLLAAAVLILAKPIMSQTASSRIWNPVNAKFVVEEEQLRILIDGIVRDLRADRAIDAAAVAASYFSAIKSQPLLLSGLQLAVLREGLAGMSAEDSERAIILWALSGDKDEHGFLAAAKKDKNSRVTKWANEFMSAQGRQSSLGSLDRGNQKVVFTDPIDLLLFPKVLSDDVRKYLTDLPHDALPSSGIAFEFTQFERAHRRRDPYFAFERTLAPFAYYALAKNVSQGDFAAQLAREFARHGGLHAAQSLISQAEGLTLSPEELDFTKAELLVLEGRWGDALEKYTRSLKADRPSVHWQMGLAYMKMARYDEAEKAFVSALDILKEHPDDLFGLLANDFAWSLLTAFDNRISRADIAERWSRQANDLTNYENSNYLDTLARCKYIKGNMTEALRIQRQAVNATSSPASGVTESLAEYELAAAIKDYSPLHATELVLDTSWYRATLLLAAVITANENLPKPSTYLRAIPQIPTDRVYMHHDCGMNLECTCNYPYRFVAATLPEAEKLNAINRLEALSEVPLYGCYEVANFWENNQTQRRCRFVRGLSFSGLSKQEQDFFKDKTLGDDIKRVWFEAAVRVDRGLEPVERPVEFVRPVAVQAKDSLYVISEIYQPPSSRCGLTRTFRGQLFSVQACSKGDKCVSSVADSFLASLQAVMLKELGAYKDETGDAGPREVWFRVNYRPSKVLPRPKYEKSVYVVQWHPAAGTMPEEAASFLKRRDDMTGAISFEVKHSLDVATGISGKYYPVEAGDEMDRFKEALAQSMQSALHDSCRNLNGKIVDGVCVVR